ncbi:MAG: T9SS type A sorting domain-containing protein [Bacteroidetes bacterium]|nr:MAG: T9SS type A sorting domain-containing protein [Bacteroidota bacterium]
MTRFLSWVGVVCLLLTTGLLRAQTESCASEWLQTHYTNQDTGFYLMKKAIGNRVQHFRQHKNDINTGFNPGSGSGNNLSAGCNLARFIIPVVVHIDTTDNAANITDAQVQHQIDILNTAFSGTEIQFCLAKKRPNGTSFNGINRIAGNNTSNRLTLQIGRLAQLAYYNPVQYLNIYVVKDILTDAGASTGYAGYNAIYPGQNGTDGVVVRYNYFGNAQTCTTGCNTLVSYSRGFTLVHEVGHYLGLLHTFEGGCNGGNTAATCGSQGDNCCDTRPQPQLNNCPTVNHTNSCPTYHLSIDENLENYMSYAKDTCQNNFTANQIEVMHSTLEGPRSYLGSPLNVNTKELSCCMGSAFFTASNNLLCLTEVVTFTAYQYTGSTKYRWIIADSTGSVVKDTTLTNNHIYSYTFSQNNRYTVTLKVIFGSNNDTITFGRTGFIEKKNCGTPLQSIHANWYFGNFAGLNFTTAGAIRDLNPKFRDPINVNTQEGTYGISNPYGRLLFYAAARPNFDSLFNYQPQVDVYNRNYARVSNGPLHGFGDASQGGVIVPMPGNKSKYYIFTVSELTGFHYSIYDTTVNSGLGNIDTNYRNVPVPAPSGSVNIYFKGDSTHSVGEIITAIPKCNGKDYWVIVGDVSVLTYTPKFPNYSKLVVYSLDSLGLSFHSVLPYTVETRGGLKASPDGTRLAVPPYIFDFDKSNATVKIHSKIPATTMGAGALWSGSFSPNSNVYYHLQRINDNVSKLVQVDLLNPDTLTASKEILTYYNPYYMALQLAPDNKIYVSRLGVGQLTVINNPDEVVTSAEPNKCGFTDNGPMLSVGGLGGECSEGLPNNVDAKLPSEIPLDFVRIDSTCFNVRFRPNECCATSYKWHFGDGDSSSLREPNHTYGDTGLYTVSLKINGTQTVQKDIFIGIRSKIQDEDTACVLDSSIVNYTITHYDDKNTYSWSVINGASMVGYNNTLAVNWYANTGKVVLNMSNFYNTCTATDTLAVTPIFLSANTIWPDTALCSGTPLHILGNVTTSNIGTVSYQWQYSSDGVTWNITNAGDTLQELSGSIQDTTLWYRRVAKHRLSYCQFTSNSEKIIYRPRAYIQRQPQNSIACPGGWREFSIGVETPPGVTVTSTWNFQFKNATGWNYLFYIGDTIRDWPTTTAYDSAKYRCTVSTPCGALVSDTAYVLIEKNPSITNHPQTQTVLEGDSAIFTVTSTAFKPYYTWYQSTNNGLSWDTIPSGHNDTLVVRNVTACDHKNLYRVAPTICLNETSDSATINVITQIDLWSKDGAADTGAEPNIDTARDYWGSPDLWNCWPSQGCSTHRSPEFMNSGWNYLNARVRNKGTQTSGRFEVKTYWTLGGFYEQWPLSWHYDTINNGFYDSITMKRYPMGGEIGAYTDSNLTTGSSQVYEFQWSPPYPGWYAQSPYFGSNNISHPLCVLSRIVTCPDTPFGMTYPEIIPTGENMINNNNIVTRNTEVYDSIGFNKTTPEWILRMGNQWPVQRKIRLTIENPVTNFWDLGYYVVQLDPMLYNAWEEGGSNGEGFNMDGNTFVITDDGFFLDNITLEAGQWGWAHFQFRLHEETVMDEDRGQQMFSFVQHSAPIGYEEYEPDGGFNFLLNLLPEPPPHIDSLEFTISPNPADVDFITVDMDMNFATSTAVLDILDTWGNPMISTYSLGSLSVGNNNRTIYIGGVSAGTYTVVITANGNTYTEPIIILNH